MHQRRPAQRLLAMSGRIDADASDGPQDVFCRRPISVEQRVAVQLIDPDIIFPLVDLPVPIVRFDPVALLL